MNLIIVRSALFSFLLVLTLSVSSPAQLRGWGWNNFFTLGPTSTPAIYTPISLDSNQTTGVSGGWYLTLYLQADGTVLSCGRNIDGELGDGTTNTRYTIAPVSGITNAVQVSAGLQFAVALLADGTVKSWGNGQGGRLGDGTYISHATPATVPGLTDVIAVDAGYTHVLALKSDGTVWSWGAGGDGQLGNNTYGYSPVPVRVPNLSNVIAIGSSASNSMALKSDGTVWVWGQNAYGQLGNGSTEDRGANHPVQASITDVAQIPYHGCCMALKSDGTLWAWGANYAGQLGNGTSYTVERSPVKVPSISGPVEIYNFIGTNYVRMRDGSLMAWGQNDFGKVGNGTASPDQYTGVTTPTAVSAGTGNVFLSAGYTHAVAGWASQITVPAGANRTLQGQNLKFKFANVTTAGTLSYSALDSTSPAVTNLTLPANYTIKTREPAYTVTTNAAFTGAQVCLPIKGEFDSVVINKMKLMNAEGGALVDRTSSIDFQRHQICGTVNSLSAVVIAEGPTSLVSNFNISGRVTNAAGRPLYLIPVAITDQAGNVRYTQTNQFGYYKFLNSSAFSTYTMTVPDKRYDFSPKTISSAADLSGMDFTGTRRTARGIAKANTIRTR